MTTKDSTYNSSDGGFSPYFTTKNGRIIRAADYGHKAFCFKSRPKNKKR